MNLSRARTIIDTSSRKMYKYYKEFAERLRPSSWCPATWCVVTIRTKRTFNSPTCAFRHERRVVVRHSFLREEKRFNRISPTQKTTATLTSRESFSLTHTHTHTHTHSQIFLLPTTISYNTEKCFQRERWIGIDRSYFTTVILLRKKRWSARNKLSKTAWKMRSHIGIIRDSTWNHLEQFAFSQCVSWDLNA